MSRLSEKAMSLMVASHTVRDYCSWEALWNYIAELEAEIGQLTAHDATERQDDKWIPVSKRLPDNWKSVLTIDMSESTRVPVPAFYDPETSLWSTHLPNYDLWVTHWMPLPNPPEVNNE